VWLGDSVRSIQRDVSQRQQFINQSAQLGRVNEALVRALAQAALKENDDRLRDLLSQNGITINVTPTPATGSAPAGGPVSNAPAAGGAESPTPAGSAPGAAPAPSAPAPSASAPSGVRTAPTPPAPSGSKDH
jgi:hypothetical protein